MAKQRPNFYDLLDLDPSVRDPAAIEERIREKKDQWAREIAGPPKARARAEQAQSLLKDLQACLENPECREREAREAEALRAEERARNEKELQQRIGYLGGVCSAERLDRLAKEFTGVFSREEILERLRRAGVRVEGQDPGPGPTPEPQEELDPVTARAIRDRLDLLGLADLYEFLGLGRDVSPVKLRKAAAEKLKENRDRSRRDALLTAENDLASYCQEVFESAATKAAYDRYLTVAAMDRMRDEIEFAGAEGLLTREAMDALVRNAGELGVEAAAARAYIEDLARERGWKVDPGAVPRPEPAGPSGARGRSPEGPDAGRYLGFLLPYLRGLARRPAVAVPAGLTVLGMSGVLVASVGAPSAPAQGGGSPAAQTASATGSSPPAPSPSSGPAPSPAPSPSSSPSSASSGGGRGGPAAAAAGGGAAPPGPQEDVSEPPRADGSGAQDPTEGMDGQEPSPPGPPVPTPAPAPPPAPPPPVAPQLPAEPRVAVVATGDERIGPLVEEVVGGALQDAGLQARDARGSLALSELLRSSRGRPPVAELAEALDAEGFEVLVLAEIEAVGERRLEFYGRTERATTSRVRLTAYSLFDQRSLGSGWLDEVEHTSRGADQQVPQGVAPGGVALARQVADGWDRRLSETGGRR